jgi:ABC-type transport system substrate-binding protein
VIPPSLPGYQPELAGYPYDPAKARALLAAAGLAGGFTTDLWSPNDQGTLTVVQAIQADLQAVGVTVNLHAVDYPTFTATYTDPAKAPLYYTFWLQDYPDASDFFSNLLTPTGGTNNAGGYDNPQVDALVSQAALTADQVARNALYAQAEKLVVADAPWLFLYHSITYHVRQPWAANYYIHPVHIWRWADYYLTNH